MTRVLGFCFALALGFLVSTGGLSAADDATPAPQPQSEKAILDVTEAVFVAAGCDQPKEDAKFADESKLNDHFRRHGGDFGATTAIEYEAMARKFLTGPRAPGVLEKTKTNGDVVRYDPKTEDFGVLAKDGITIRTFFKPNPKVHGRKTNLDYFYDQ